MGLLEDILGFLSESLRASGELARKSSERGGEIADSFISKKGNLESAFINDVISSSPIGATSKAVKELPHLQRLQAALESFLQPGKLQAVKNRLQPALKIGKGEPSAENLMIGPPGTFHNALFEKIPDIPSSGFQHGYFDPENKVFLDDMLNSILYDPDQLKTTSRLLKGGLSLDAIKEALGFRKGL